MPLCNRKGSLLNLIIKDLDGEDGPRSPLGLPPGSPLRTRRHTGVYPAGSPVSSRKGRSLPATASPLIHRKFPGLVRNSSGFSSGSSGSFTRFLGVGEDAVFDAHRGSRPRSASPAKIRYRRSSKPELNTRFSFDSEDLTETSQVKFSIGGDESDDEESDAETVVGSLITAGIQVCAGEEKPYLCGLELSLRRFEDKVNGTNSNIDDAFSIFLTCKQKHLQRNHVPLKVHTFLVPWSKNSKSQPVDTRRMFNC